MFSQVTSLRKINLPQQLPTNHIHERFLISSCRFRGKRALQTGATEGPADGEPTSLIVQQPDAATLPTLVGKHSIRFQQAHADEATSRSRHLPHPRRRRPARRGRCAPPLSLHRANPGRAAWERRVRRRGGHGSRDPGSVECATPEGMGGASDLGDRAALGHGCVPCTGHKCATCPRWIVEAGRCARFNGHSTTIAPLMWDNRKA